MAKALWQATASETGTKTKASPAGWSKRMSDHIAYGLLVYTGVNIYVTMAALKSQHGSILPYFGLVLLVAAIIPGCRLFERRWEALPASGLGESELHRLFNRDRAIVWIAAIGLPVVVTGLIKGLLALV
ncbi:hypothetical protein [Tsuneonella sp. HG222]